MSIERPILVGGLGLTAALGMFQTFHHSLAHLGDWTMLGVLAAGGVAWWLQGMQSPDLTTNTPTLTKELLESTITTTEATIASLEAEIESLTTNAKPAMSVVCSNLRQQLKMLTTELDRTEIRLAVAGAKGSGKSTVIQWLKNNWLPQQEHKVTLQEIPIFFTAENQPPLLANIQADLVIFLTASDLTEPEFQILQNLKNSGIRSILLWNKQDLCLPAERTSVLQQQQIKLQDTIYFGDIMAIAAAPIPLKVRRHLEDGTWQEWLEEQAPEMEIVNNRLNEIIEKEAQQLIFSGTYYGINAIKNEAKELLNKVRKDKALPRIEESQWIAAAAALANPVPALDLLATGAITAQLVVDLGGIYQQQFSLEQAKTVAGTMAELMFKLGLVEISTQTVTHLLKSNAFTFVAGGAVQGVSAAYLTRIAGLSFIEYFQEQEVNTQENNPFNVEQLKMTLQKVFQQNQRQEFLQTFVKQGINRLMPETGVAG